MKDKAWDNLWRDKERQLLWSKPDKDVVSLMPRLKREKVHRVLDLGCGVGRHVVLMAKLGFEVYALDSSEYAVEHCRNWLRAEGVQATIEHGDMDKLTYPNSVFDFVLAWNVIYHTTRKKMALTLEEVQRVLIKDGLFYLTLNSTRNKNCGGGIEVEDNTFDNPEKEDGQHLHHYSDEYDVRDLLSNWHIESIIEAEAKETGDSFKVNAIEKARFYFNLSKLPVLADDGGLEIDYLNGRPGVKSRRWPGHKASDEELITYTLEKLEGLPVSERGAQLRVVVALAFPGDNETYTFEGVLKGTITKKPIKKRIRGYPFRSIFIPKQSKEYLGEMSLVAHRKEAIEKAIPVIREHLFPSLENTK